jgi:hypothetical protein
MNGSLQNVHGELLFRMVASAAVGERLKVSGPIGGRYFSTATGGGRFEGPRLQGRLLEGFAWAPHRTRTGDAAHMHYDVRVLLLTDDGFRIVMRYRGVNSPAYPHRSWRTAPVFEAEHGPYAWLNAIQAIGLGRVTGSDVEYEIYQLTD